MTDFFALRYNRDGNVYQRIEGHASASFVYDAQGRRLEDVRDDGTEPPAIYTYDPEGKLIAIEGEEDQTTTFEYDEQGRKTRIVKSNVKPSPSSNVSVYGNEVDVHPYGGFLGGIENEDLRGIPPDGGLIRTSFNDRGQATESQVYSADGRLASRLSFTYDAKGRVAEFSSIQTKLEYLLSPEDLARIGEKPGPAEGVQRELVARISYLYDDANHVVQERDFGARTITKLTYNDHGDKIEAIATTYDGDLDEPKAADENAASGGGPDSQLKALESDVVQFSYQYDGFGNWIEKTVSSPAKADKSSMTWSVSRRTITYY